MDISEAQCDPVPPGVRAPEHGSVPGELDPVATSLTLTCPLKRSGCVGVKQVMDDSESYLTAAY